MFLSFDYDFDYLLRFYKSLVHYFMWHICLILFVLFFFGVTPLDTSICMRWALEIDLTIYSLISWSDTQRKRKRVSHQQGTIKGMSSPHRLPQWRLSRSQFHVGGHVWHLDTLPAGQAAATMATHKLSANSSQKMESILAGRKKKKTVSLEHDSYV